MSVASGSVRGRGFRAAWSILGLGLLVACSQASDETHLTVTGSSTVAPVVAEIAKRYEAMRPGIRIDVQTGGSSRGILDIRSGLAEIGMVSRELAPEESDLVAVPIAKDGVALIVHRDNPVSRLDFESVQRLYRGEVSTWRELGGPDVVPVIVTKAEGRATLEVFSRHFDLDVREIAADVVIGDNEQAVKTVVGQPAAIAFVSIGTALFDLERGDPIRLIEVDGIPATLENVASGAYPVSRRLMVVTKAVPTGVPADFIEFLRSAAAASVIADQRFVQVGS